MSEIITIHARKKFLKKWKSHHKNAVSLLRYVDLIDLDLKIYMLLQMFL